MKQSLNQMLDQLAQSSMVPMHMPGHKRNTNLCGTTFDYARDITEIAGFDNLHNMQGVLKTQSINWAKLYGADTAFMLTGGSTCGVLAAIQALLPNGGEMLMDRGSHKSLYHAAYLMRAKVHYLQPKLMDNGIADSIDPAQVENMLKKHPGIQVVCITSPSYEGVISDIAAISRVCHRAGAKLFVDSAHGAHSCLDVGILSPIIQGADVATVSLHKTLPSPTSTALLLGADTVNKSDLQRGFDIFETSSPSYILLAAMEHCQYMLITKGEQLARQYKERLTNFYNQCGALCHLQLLGLQPALKNRYDMGKIVIDTTKASITGTQLASRLRSEYQIECEMAMEQYCLCMSSICDTDDSFLRLQQALVEIDKQLHSRQQPLLPNAPIPQKVAETWQMMGTPTKKIALEQAAGCVSQEYVWAYPPGVPWLVPGEIISAELVKRIQYASQYGVELYSTYQGVPQYIEVWDLPQKNIDGTGKS